MEYKGKFLVTGVQPQEANGNFPASAFVHLAEEDGIPLQYYFAEGDKTKYPPFGSVVVATVRIRPKEGRRAPSLHLLSWDVAAPEKVAA